MLAFVALAAYNAFMSKLKHTAKKPSPTARAARTDEGFRQPKARAKSRQRPGATEPARSAASSPADEIRRARKAGRAVTVAIARSARVIPLSDALIALLANALEAHANGHSVELVINSNRAEPPNPYLILDRDPNDELTTQEAAAALRVSRPTIIKAIDEGKLPARKVGKHRRVRVYDFNAFARSEQLARVEHARESDRLEQAIGMYELTLPKSGDEWKQLVRQSSARPPKARS